MQQFQKLMGFSTIVEKVPIEPSINLYHEKPQLFYVNSVFCSLVVTRNLQDYVLL